MTTIALYLFAVVCYSVSLIIYHNVLIVTSIPFIYIVSGSIVTVHANNV